MAPSTKSARIGRGSPAANRVRNGARIALCAVLATVATEKELQASCESEVIAAQRTPSPPTFLGAAECLHRSGRLEEADSYLTLARRVASPFDSAAQTEIARIYNNIQTTGAAQAVFTEIMAQLRARKDDVQSARLLLERAEKLARTKEQLIALRETADEIFGGVPKFAIDGRFHTSILGFIGSGSSLTTERFFNTKNALGYSVAPIVLGGASLKLRTFDATGWERLGLKLGFETARVFGGGGEIATTTLARQLGVTGVAADIVNGALALAGVGFEGEYATFTNGRVRRIDVPSNTIAEDAPLRFTRTRLEGTFNATPYLWANSRPTVEEHRSMVTIHALYYHLGIPRIAYLTQRNATGDTIVVVESEPQTIGVGFGAAGLSGKLAAGNDVGSIGILLALMGGAGKVSFDMPARLSEAPGPNNRLRLNQTALALVSRAGVFGELHVAGETYAGYLGASITGEQYYVNAEVPGSVEGSVGFADAFFSALITATFRYRSLPGH